MKNVSYALAIGFMLSAQHVSAADMRTREMIADSVVALQNSSWETGTRQARAALRDPNLNAAEMLTAVTSLCIQAANAGQYDVATAACDRSISLSPQRWSGYLNRANLRLMMRDREGAAADYAVAKSMNAGEEIIPGSRRRIELGLGGYYVGLVPTDAERLIQQATAD